MRDQLESTQHESATDFKPIMDGEKLQGAMLKISEGVFGLELEGDIEVTPTYFSHETEAIKKFLETGDEHKIEESGINPDVVIRLLDSIDIKAPAEMFNRAGFRDLRSSVVGEERMGEQIIKNYEQTQEMYSLTSDAVEKIHTWYQIRKKLMDTLQTLPKDKPEEKALVEKKLKYLGQTDVSEDRMIAVMQCYWWTNDSIPLGQIENSRHTSSRSGRRYMDGRETLRSLSRVTHTFFPVLRDLPDDVRILDESQKKYRLAKEVEKKLNRDEVHTVIRPDLVKAVMTEYIWTGNTDPILKCAKQNTDPELEERYGKTGLSFFRELFTALRIELPEQLVAE